MNESSSITISYTITKEFCHCCKRALEEPFEVERMHTVLNRKDIFNDMDWETYAQYEDDFKEIVHGFLYDVIEFRSGQSSGRIIIPEGQINKMMDYIKYKMKVGE